MKAVRTAGPGPATRPPRSQPLSTTTAGVLGTIAVAGYMALLMWGVGHWSYDSYGGLFMVPVLLLLGVPVLVRLGRSVPEVGAQVLVLALVLKLASAGARYVQSFVIAGGADAERYHKAGIRISTALHENLPWKAEGPWPGTGFMEAVAGYAYWATGTSRIGGFFLFSFLSFWGLVLFVLAFRTAFPDGFVRRYAIMVLFLPSLLFWPSSLGKDSWMTLMLGISAYGAALLYRNRLVGAPFLAAGITGAIMVRPHMAVLLFGALFVGYVLRPIKPGAAFAPIFKMAGVAVLLAAGTLVLVQAETFFSNKGGDATGALEEANRRTSQGGSEFDAEPVSSPVQIPGAVVTVLLRPFPYEASNAESLVASFEGLLVMGLALRYRRSLAQVPRRVLREPYIAFCLTYGLLFVVAFSSFGNFGILTRQRVQVFPFVLVLLALPLTTAAVTGARAGRPGKRPAPAGRYVQQAVRPPSHR